MYSKDDLLSKSVSDLEDIATELGAEKNGNDAQTLIYSILDKQAIDEGNKNPLGNRKRRVKSANRSVIQNNMNSSELQDGVDSDGDTSNEDTPKRKRGRRPKAEVEKERAELLAKIKMNKQQEKDLNNKTDVLVLEEDLKNNPNIIVDDRLNIESKTGFEIEDSIDNSIVKGGEDDALIAQLQAKIKAHNDMVLNEDGEIEQELNTSDEEVMPVSYWEGDPGDGTDFITVVDIPVEDESAIPSYDMLDNPINYASTPMESIAYNQSLSNTSMMEEYDFEDLIIADGVLEVMSDGYGFLRSSDYNYLSSPDDIYLSAQQIKKYGLKTGDVIQCRVRPPREGEKYFPLTSVDRINGRNPAEIRDRVPFEHLTPLFPDEKFILCGNPNTTNMSTRIVDLFSPIGKGQRALIVAQPKTGKTILMKDIANAIAANHPEAYLMMLLIDERPEEVTDMARTVNAEVIASTFDEPAERHVKIAGIVLEKAKRLVEAGHDVVIFLDSITRLARAYNTVSPASGKVLTGGVDANALQKPKRFFGAARNIEGGGSLTIIATALTDTGSKMDEVIFEEFKGTGNMELQLERSLSNKRIFPAVNLVASSTRRDDLLQDRTTLDRMWILRKYISDMNPIEAMNTIHNRMEKTRDNDEFLFTMND